MQTEINSNIFPEQSTGATMSRYLNYVWPSVHLVHDMDDTRKNAYGVYYTQKRPLTLATFDDNLPGI